MTDAVGGEVVLEHDDVLEVAPALSVEQVNRLAASQDVASLGTWDYEPATGTVAWDEHCAALFGTTLHGFAGTLEAFEAAVHPDDVDQVRLALRDTVEHGLPFDLAYRAMWSDGQVRHLISRGKALCDSDGTVERVMGATVDVTDMHWAVRELEVLFSPSRRRLDS